MEKHNQKWHTAVLTIALIVLLCAGMTLPAAAASTLTVEYDLNVGGENVISANAGESILVNVTLRRTDADEGFSVFGTQCQILYDTSFFSVVKASDVVTKVMDTSFVRYFNSPMIKVTSLGRDFASAETVVSSFYMKPKADLPLGASSTVYFHFTEVFESETEEGTATTKALTVYIGEVPKQTYDVTYELSGGTMDPTAFPEIDAALEPGETPVYAVSVEENEAIVLPPAATRTGYTFTGWSDGENTYSAGANYTVTHETTFHACWEPLHYTVTFDANGGDIAPSDVSREVAYNSPYGAMPVVTRNHYDFDGWYTLAEGGDQVTEATTLNVGEDRTVYAHWTPFSYTVIFNFADSGITDQSFQRDYDSVLLPADEPTPDAAAYAITGYSWGDLADVSFSEIVAAFKVADTAAGNTIAVHTKRMYHVAPNAELGTTAAVNVDSTDGYTAMVVAPDFAAYAYTVILDDGNGHTVRKNVNSGTGEAVFSGDDLYEAFAAGSNLTATVARELAHVTVDVYPFSNSIVLVTAYSPVTDVLALSYNGVPMYKDLRVAAKTYDADHTGLYTYAILLNINKVSGYIASGNAKDLGAFKAYAEGLIAVNNGAVKEIADTFDVTNGSSASSAVVDVSDATLVYNVCIGTYAYTANHVTGVLTSRDQQFLLSDATLTANGAYDIAPNLNYNDIGPDCNDTQLIDLHDVLEVYNHRS